MPNVSDVVLALAMRKGNEQLWVVCQGYVSGK
jgi:hypothetical protein